MKTIKELRAEQAKILANARAELEQIDDNTDEARAAEIEASFDAAMVEHDKIEKVIERQLRLEQLENAGDPRRPTADPGEERDEPVAPEYREVFAMAICGQQEMMTAEQRNVLKQGMTQFRNEQRAQVGSTTTAGGFTVPITLKDEIIKSMLAWGPMYDPGLCTEIPTSAGSRISIPTVDDTAVTAEAHTEGTALTDDGGKDVTFGQKTLSAFAFDTEFIRWSWELDMDSIFSMEQLLGSLLGERLGRIANAKLTVGAGTTEPWGIVTRATLGKTAASNTAVTADEVLEFVHSVDPAYRASPKTRAMFNDSTLLALRKLKDGTGNYLITEAPDGSGRLRVGAVSVPYSINQAMAGLTKNQKFMVFGDFSKYYVRKVGDPVIGVLKERFWPDMGIAGLVRFDGELGDTAAVKYMATGNT